MRFLTTLSFFVVFVGFIIVAEASDFPVGAPGFSKVEKAKVTLRILISNDDSWASANIRAFYYALKTAGHSVLMVAPAINQSGTGGTVVLPMNKTLITPGRYDSIPVGAPFSGSNDTDKGLNYFAGTPAACVLWALDNVVPTFFGGKEVQLIASGPNEGTNLGPFLYTLSGTIGASYSGVERGYPAIAFSASNAARNYTSLNYSDVNDEAIRIGTLSTNFVTRLASQRDSGKRIFPLGIGASVNYASGTGLNSKCSNAKFYQTRLTGGAFTDKIVVNSTSGLPNYQNFAAPGLNVCLSGDCSLPGETNIVAKDNCSATVSLYSVDYDAPTSALQYAKPDIQKTIASLNKRKNNKRSYQKED